MTKQELLFQNQLLDIENAFGAEARRRVIYNCIGSKVKELTKLLSLLGELKK